MTGDRRRATGDGRPVSRDAGKSKRPCQKWESKGKESRRANEGRKGGVCDVECGGWELGCVCREPSLCRHRVTYWRPPCACWYSVRLRQRVLWYPRRYSYLVSPAQPSPVCLALLPVPSNRSADKDRQAQPKRTRQEQYEYAKKRAANSTASLLFHDGSFRPFFGQKHKN